MRARAVRMVLEHQGSYETQSAAVAAIAPKIGCIPETLRVWVRQAEQDSGARDGATSAERDKIKELEREVRQLRQANEILRKASAYFAQPLTRFEDKPLPGSGNSTARSSHDRLYSLPGRALRSNGPRGDDHRVVHGVGSICRVLPIAPSIARQANCMAIRPRGDLLRLPRCARRSVQGLGTPAAGCGLAAKNPEGLG